MLTAEGGELDKAVCASLGQHKEQHHNESTEDGNAPAPCGEQLAQLKHLLHNILHCLTLKVIGVWKGTLLSVFVWQVVILCPSLLKAILLPGRAAAEDNQPQSDGCTQQAPDYNTSGVQRNNSAVNMTSGEDSLLTDRGMRGVKDGARIHTAEVVCRYYRTPSGTVDAVASHIATVSVSVVAVQHGGVVGGDALRAAVIERGGRVVEVVLEGEGGGAAFLGVTHEGQPLLSIAVSRTGPTEVANHRST